MLGKGPCQNLFTILEAWDWDRAIEIRVRMLELVWGTRHTAFQSSNFLNVSLFGSGLSILKSVNSLAKDVYAVSRVFLHLSKFCDNLNKKKMKVQHVPIYCFKLVHFCTYGIRTLHIALARSV